MMKKYVQVPHQVSITYRTPLSDEQWNDYGKRIQKRLNHITNEGVILDTKEIQVNVIPRKEYGSRVSEVALFGIETDTRTNCRYPLTLFFEGGYSISIAGPTIDFSKFLRKKMRCSKEQYHPENPFILILGTNKMIGDLEGNRRALSNAFQPEMNTRFSAVVFMEFNHNEIKVIPKFQLISNPYARKPPSTKFLRLFGSE